MIDQVQANNPLGGSSVEERRQNMTEGGGSTPSPRTSFLSSLQQWLQGEDVGLAECPYMRRWVVDVGPFAVRLHHWIKSDDDRALHDHPWWFLILVLRGSYLDISEAGVDKLEAGHVRCRPAEYKHSVQLPHPGTWTLLLTGRPARRWGFWVAGKLIKRDKYFAQAGHHPCDPSGVPVRMRPDGTRIEGGLPAALRGLSRHPGNPSIWRDDVVLNDGEENHAP